MASVVAAGFIFASMPGIIPLVVSGIAALDSDHRVMLRTGGQGADVVLRHGSCGVTAPHHQHCATARVLVFFSQSATGNPDHVLHFGAGGKFLNKNPAVVPSPGVQVSMPVFHEVSIFAPTTVFASLAAANPPAPPGALSGIRTTLLLI
jgi:hypothetical protein